MKKSLVAWQIGCFVFTAVMGVLLHFLFDFTNQSLIAAPFSAVNESVWEHMKILFFPMFVFALAESKYMECKYQNFWCVKKTGILFGVVLIPIMFYTLNGVFGKTPDWLNIAIFFIAVAGSCFLEKILFKQVGIYCKSNKAALLILVGFAVLFAVWTFVPPHIPLFEDPLTGTYGI